MKLTKLPPCEWLPENSYLQLAAIIDTFLPSFSTNDLTEELLVKTLADFGIDANSPNSPFQPKELLKLRRFLTAGALDYGTHRHILKSITDNLTTAEKSKISLILMVLGNSFVTWLLTGYPVSFNDLPLHIREQILLGWRDSFLEPLRSIYQLFKRLVSGHFMAYLNDQRVFEGTDSTPLDNPSWKDIGYDPDSSRSDVAMSPEDLAEDKILREQMNIDYVLKHLNATANEAGEHCVTVDAVIVGSGCGGGVVAYNLVQQGYTVLVLEKAGYYNRAEFAKWREIDALGKSFDKAGMLSTEDANFAIFAGSCVGGGSTINWSASFATPSHVLEDWAALGLPAFTPTDTQAPYAVAMRQVQSMFHINSDNSYRPRDDDSSSFVVNENNRILWENAEKLGFQAERIPRNVKDCVDCGHCCYGCAHKRKQSTVHTLLEPLLLAQGGQDERLHEIAHRMTGSTTEILRSSTGSAATTKTSKAEGVLAVARSAGPDVADAKQYTLRITSKVTCVSAGSIQTPALLLRSQLQHPGIGRGLCLHPVVPIAAFMNQTVETRLSNGVSMGVVVREPKIYHQQTGNDRHPVALETPPGHPAIMSTVIPWQGGLLYKLLMAQYRHIAALVGIPRDQSQPSNRVVIDKEGEPVVYYRMTPHDQDMVLAGIEQGLRFLVTDPRAVALFVGHSSFPCFSRKAEEETAEAFTNRFEAYLVALRKEGVQALRTQMYSAHQISSVRMAATVEEGPVSPEGELFECENLYVADGSVLPTSLGINPMLTIEAMAQMIAQHVASRLAAMRA
eukprot:gene3066-2244_t